MKITLRALKLLCLACALSFGLMAFVPLTAKQTGTAATPQPSDETRPQVHAAPPGAEQRHEAKEISAASADPVDVLDRVVRARFHNHIGFGMARIASERKFEPETEEERQAIRAIKRAGIKIGLFIVGRGILAETPPAQRHVSNRFGGLWVGRQIAGPIFLNSTEAKKLPDLAPYWGEARRAMLSFATGGESYEFAAGEWRALARPVRAVESCLQCHTADVEAKEVTVNGRTFYRWEQGSNKLKVGDPLGSMLYVYKRGK